MIVTEREARSCWPGTFLVEGKMEITEQNENKPPTHHELVAGKCDDGSEIKKVLYETDCAWRDGMRVFYVYNRLSDDTYWMVNFYRIANCEIDTLRDGSCPIVQVRKTVKVVETIEYEVIK